MESFWIIDQSFNVLCDFDVGRVNLVDLQQSLNVDLSHIETKVNELVKNDRSLTLILGQLINR